MAVEGVVEKEGAAESMTSLWWMMARAQLRALDFAALQSAVDGDVLKTLEWRNFVEAPWTDRVVVAEEVADRGPSYFEEDPVDSETRAAKSVRVIEIGEARLVAAYPYQLASRVADDDGALVYECYEYRRLGSATEATADAVRRGRAALSAVSREPPAGRGDVDAGSAAALAAADVGSFCESRQFRIRIPLTAITKAGVFKAKEERGNLDDDDDDDEVLGRLVVEATAATCEVRRVHSRQRMDNEWTPADDDWIGLTPGKVVEGVLTSSPEEKKKKKKQSDTPSSRASTSSRASPRRWRRGRRELPSCSAAAATTRATKKKRRCCGTTWG